MPQKTPAIVMEVGTDPESSARARRQDERHKRNGDWLEAHAAEVYSHRGKHICIAGQELFVGEDAVEVFTRARAAHPEDDGAFVRYVPLERTPRIYALRWTVVDR